MLSELVAPLAYQFQLEEDSSSGPAVLYQAVRARLNDESQPEPSGRCSAT